MSQLRGGSNELTLDLSPLLKTVKTELAATRLAPLADKIEIDDKQVIISLQSDAISTVRSYYEWSQKAIIALVITMLLATGLAIGLSVHHGKTARRIALSTGVFALLVCIALSAPSIVKSSDGTQLEQAAALAVAESVFSDLKIVMGIIAGAGIGGALASKLYVVRKNAANITDAEQKS